VIVAFQVPPFSQVEQILMRFRREGFLCLCLILVGTVLGCPGRPPASKPGDSSPPSTQQQVSADDLLKSAIHQLRPENYSIAAATDKPINLLNSWKALHVAKTPDANDSAEAPALPVEWADKDEAARLNGTNFDLTDAVHVRDAILTHTIATFLAARSNDELSRVQEVFHFVVRNIALQGENDPSLPIGIYQILLLGRGSAEDRSWVCASILKQLRIDSLIVRPPADAGADDDAWLLGVVLNERVYLFDPRLGIALPSSADLAAVGAAPATLDQIAAHPEWLQPLSLRADQPYRLDAESLAHPRCFPIAESPYWSRRMKLLEEAMPAEDQCLLYDPLVDDAGRTGMLTRITAALSGATREDLKPWSYPRQQTVAARAINPRQRQQWELATGIFSVPIPVLIDAQKKTASPGTPERKMLKFRTEQLLGKFNDATKQYLSIRRLEITPGPIPELVTLNQLAAEDAIYWTALCKFDAGEFEGAVEQLNGYVRRFERNGRWIFAARSLLAESHAELGQFDKAAAAIERSLPDDPYREANAIRIKRWNARAGQNEGTGGNSAK
jgi:tetratricopeptide (TPR) repeat protein